LKLTWKSFNEEFQDEILTRFRENLGNVEKEVMISHLIETSRDRDIMQGDREEREHRRKGK